MKAWFGIILLKGMIVIASSILSGQPSASVDSLKNALRLSSRLDSAKWILLQDLSRSYALSVPDSALFFAKEAYQLATHIKNDVFLFKSLNLIGVAYIRKQAEEKAFSYFLQALEFAKTHQGKEWQKYQAQALINISGVMWMQNQVEKALPYIHNARYLLEALDEPKVLADCYQTLGLMHERIPQLDSSLHYLGKALSIYKQINDVEHQGRVLEVIGHNNVKLKYYEKALLFYNDALEIAEKEEDIVNVLIINNNKAEVFIKMKAYSKAQNALRTTLSLATAESFDEHRAHAYQLLSELYRLQNQFDSAYYYLNENYQLEKELLNKDKSATINKLEIAYQTEQRTRENETLRSKNQIIQTRGIYVFIISILLFIGFIFTLLYLIRLKRNNQVIAQQKTEVNGLLEALKKSHEHLSSLSEEKSTLVSLITHDIQTPLSIIKFTTASLFQEGKTGQMSADLKAIELATEQIGHLSRRIVEVQRLDDVDFTIKIEALNLVQIVKNTIPFYAQWGKKKNIRVKEEIDVETLCVEGDAFLLSEAFGNLLGNAIKFSQPGKNVTIKMRRQNGFAILSIEDEGPGMTLEDQSKIFLKFQKLSAQPTFGEPGTGNGLYLTKRYVDFMGGEIIIESTLGMGSTFTIQMPLMN